MTLYAFNRRIEVRSTYHVRRRARVLRVKPGIMRQSARDALVLWVCFGGLVTLATAVASLVRSL